MAHRTPWRRYSCRHGLKQQDAIKSKMDPHSPSSHRVAGRREFRFPTMCRDSGREFYRTGFTIALVTHSMDPYSAVLFDPSARLMDSENAAAASRSRISRFGNRSYKDQEGPQDGFAITILTDSKQALNSTLYDTEVCRVRTAIKRMNNERDRDPTSL